MNGKIRILSSVIISIALINLSPPAMSQAEKTYKEKIMDEKIAPGNITIDFKDADIRTVLRVLSEKSGINIVAGKDVGGRITIRLTNVYWERVLDMICKTYGYAFEREENIIRVTTIENLQQEELTTEVFTLNYAKANEVMESVKEMLTERGRDKIKYDERTNLLIVTDIPTNLYRVRQVIGKLDRRTPQVLIEAKIIETTLDKDENLGINWALKLSAAGAARPTTIPFQRIGSRILGMDTDLGKYLPSGRGADADEASDFPLLTAPHVLGLAPFPLATVEQFTMGTLDFSEVAMVMEFLRSRRDTNVLSNPRIATLNNQEASILVGQILAIPTFERNSDTGTIEITGYTEKDLGIKLSVTPHINEQGDIVVDLKPEISDLIGFDTLDEARGLKAPRYSTREAETQVMVKNGQTIMIGGLIEETTIDYEKKVPWLGDIPVLGKVLFTKTEEGIDKTELLIFLTVHIINEEPSAIGTIPSSAFVPLSGTQTE